MIHRIYSNLESFRELRLTPSLNVILANKREDASDRQTRNEAGKTSLIELIHFLLGGNVRKDSIFRSEPLAPWKFGLEIDLQGQRMSIERSGCDCLRVAVASGNTSNWPIQPTRNRTTGKLTLTNTYWKSVLAQLVFGLRFDRNKEHGSFSTTFRSILPYFARREADHGFSSHFAHSTKQQPWMRQVGISYLLGLDWSVSQRFQLLREQEKAIKQLRATVRKGFLPAFKGSAASLRTQVTLAEAKASSLRQQLGRFNVVPKYESIEREATELTRDMNRLGNENTADRQLLDELRKALGTEREPDAGDLDAMFREAEIVMPELVRKRFSAAIDFHRAIISKQKGPPPFGNREDTKPNRPTEPRKGRHGKQTGRIDGDSKERRSTSPVHASSRGTIETAHGCRGPQAATRNSGKSWRVRRQGPRSNGGS